MNSIQVNPITTELVDKIKTFYPLEIKDRNNIIEIELSHEKYEIWGFPFVGGVEPLDDAIRSLEEHRKVIPAALNRCKNKIKGIFFAGYYIKKLQKDKYEHGLVVIPANRDSKNLNKELLTSYCYEREALYKNMMNESYFHQIELFLNTYGSICKKYWIQETRLENTCFTERPSENTNKLAPTSVWHTVIYPDFMRPVNMIGDIYIDFMLCENNLIYLQNDLDENDSIWSLFEEENIKNINSMQSNFIQNNFKSNIEGICETIDFELSSRKDLNYNTIFDIAVPGLKGYIINEEYTIGWCGKIAFKGIGLDKTLYISPSLLKPINENAEVDVISYENKAFWRNRDIEYRKKVKQHNLVKVSDILILESEAKHKLIEHSKIVLQSCKKPFKEIQKGINKFVIRYLKGLSRGYEEKIVHDFIEQLNNVKTYSDEQEILLNIINWAQV